MATTETARLEREAEETRARLEQTLGELRARMSPGQLFDQASDYFRNNSGRAYLGSLRDEVVHNPVPVALIGAGIAWLAISGTMGWRRGNGRGDLAKDWGRTAGIADDLGHGGRGPSAMQRARQTAEGWVDEARDAMSGARENASDVSERASTAYDETIGQARQAAEGWTEDARAGAHQARETLHEGAENMRDRASAMYDQTAGGMRRAAHRAAEYGRAARHSLDRDGALVTFCREQPLLVAGLGVAVGAALGAMIPASRPERQVMGEASRDVQDRVRAAASETLHAAVGGEAQRQAGDGDSPQRESWQSEAGRGDSPRADAKPRESRQGETYREAAADLERGMQQSDRASNIESEPRSAPYAEASEAGAMGTPAAPGEEQKQRT